MNWAWLACAVATGAVVAAFVGPAWLALALAFVTVALTVHARRSGT